MKTKVVYGGAAAHISEENIPSHNLPRHPITGAILPRRNAMGENIPLQVKIWEEEEEYQLMPFFDESLGLYTIS